MMPVSPAAPIYAVTLSPHRALDRAGMHRVIAFTALLALVPGLVFFSMGAWPVVGFLGLEVLLLYWAMSHSLNEVHAFEEVVLHRHSLELRSVSARGKEKRLRFNPFFVRFSTERDDEGRITALRLASREGALEIGAFLGPDDKALFAREFGPALHRARS
ncbi:DUF2244 domain-containing protein [Pelagibacterium montanilacus]|uniref:DUF2244 domain-containing protein n=1 Tax=Pelagibacterium montanilacus TaxID=2185280 RepID=UPI000F8D0ED0|nr:DUF2244 domain-containing protein [Pelagibacterium montanilacus]